MISCHSENWGNDVSTTRGMISKGKRGIWMRGGIRLEQFRVVGSKIVKKSTKHIHLYYKNFNGITIT